MGDRRSLDIVWTMVSESMGSRCNTYGSSCVYFLLLDRIYISGKSSGSAGELAFSARHKPVIVNMDFLGVFKDEYDGLFWSW